MNSYEPTILREPRFDLSTSHASATRPGLTANICARAATSRERRRIGAGHPHLRVERRERIVERGAASRIEMRDDFVEQQQRRKPRHLGDQSRMREHEADQQRLLLAGRGLRRRDALRAVQHLEIGEMRPVGGAAGGGIARAVLAQHARDSDPPPRSRAAPSGRSRPSRRARRRPRETATPDRDRASARRRAAAPSRRAPPRPRSRPRRSRARSRRASAHRGSAVRAAGCASASDRSSALTRLECVPSTASTRRSRKRRRSEAGPPNRPSIAGVSHTTLR